MVQCAVPLCGNKYIPKRDKNRKYSFHAVPFSDPIRWRNWLTRCPYFRRYALRQLESVRICNKHFHPHELVEDKNFRRLSKDAIPSLHLPQMEAENILQIRPIKRNKPISVEVVGLNLNFVSQDEMTDAVSKVPFMIAKFKPNECKFLSRKEMNKIRRKKKKNRLSFLRADSARTNQPADHQLYALPLLKQDCLPVHPNLSILSHQKGNTNLPIDHNLYTLPKPVEDLTLPVDNDLCALAAPIENTVECVNSVHSSENITILNDDPTAELKINPIEEHFVAAIHDEEANELSQILPNMKLEAIDCPTQTMENDTNLYELVTDSINNMRTPANANIDISESIEGYQHCNTVPVYKIEHVDPVDEQIPNLDSNAYAVTLDNLEHINKLLSDCNYSVTQEHDADILLRFLHFNNISTEKACDALCVDQSEELMSSEFDNDNQQNMYNMLADTVNRMSPETDRDSTQCDDFVENVDSVSVSTNELHEPLDRDIKKVKSDTQTQTNIVEDVCQAPTVAIPDVISQMNTPESPSVFLTPNIFNLLTSKSPLGAQTLESLRVLFSTIKEKHNLPVDSTPQVHSHVAKLNMNKNNSSSIQIIPSENNMITNVGNTTKEKQPQTKQTYETLVAQLNEPNDTSEMLILPNAQLSSPVSHVDSDVTTVQDSVYSLKDEENAILKTKLIIDTPKEKLLFQQKMIYKKRLRSFKVKYNRIVQNPMYAKAKELFQNYSLLSDDEKFLVDFQLRTAGSKNKVLRYKEEELKFAKNLHQISPNSYKFLQRYLNLPKSKTTLTRPRVTDNDSSTKKS